MFCDAYIPRVLPAFVSLRSILFRVVFCSVLIRSVSFRFVRICSASLDVILVLVGRRVGGWRAERKDRPRRGREVSVFFLDCFFSSI